MPPHDPATGGLSPPHDLSAERATLGALLLERDAVIAVAPWLKPDHFYLEKHGLIYAAVLACFARREPPDLATVAGELRRQNQLDLVGGLSFLAELTSAVPTAVHIAYYARIVERTAVGRALIEAGGQIAALGFDDATDLDERLSAAGELIYQVTAGRQVGQDFVPIGQVANEYAAAVEASDDPSQPGHLLGITTGFADLDEITHGCKPGELIVLAARPGVGKTSLALTIAYELARQGHAIGIFSKEMDRELLFQRLLALHLGVETTLIPRMIRAGSEKAFRGMGELSELPIHIDHTPALNTHQIRDRARRLMSERPIALWVVDYLQLAMSPNPKDDEVRRITAVSQGLMNMAREFRTPVLALSQLSRAVEGRADHIPTLSDLRGSGSIEQDASQVWFIYREEMYDRDTDKRGIAEIYIEKHRNGPIGVATLRFEKHTTRFLPL